MWHQRQLLSKTSLSSDASMVCVCKSSPTLVRPRESIDLRSRSSLQACGEVAMIQRALLEYEADFNIELSNRFTFRMLNMLKIFQRLPRLRHRLFVKMTIYYPFSRTVYLWILWKGLLWDALDCNPMVAVMHWLH